MFHARARVLLYLLLAVALRLVLATHFPLLVTLDSPDYIHSGVEIYKHLDFNSDSLRDVRMPGYPLFLATMYPLIGVRSDLLVLVQSFVGVLCVALGWKIGRLLHSQLVAEGLALFFVFNPVYLLFEHALMTEALSIFFMLLFTTAVVYCWRQPPSLWLGFVTAALLGFSVLVRVNLLPYGFTLLTVIAAYWMAVAWRQPDSKLLGAIAPVLLPLFLGLTVVLGPWLWRNYAIYNNISLSEHSARSLLMWKNMSHTMDTSLPLFQQYADGFAELDYAWLDKFNSQFRTVEAETIATAVLAEQISTHPNRHLYALVISAFDYAGIYAQGNVPLDDRAAVAWWFQHLVADPTDVVRAVPTVTQWMDYIPITQPSIWTQIWSRAGIFYLLIVRPALVIAFVVASFAFGFMTLCHNCSAFTYPQRAVWGFILAYYVTFIFHAITLTGSDRFASISDWLALLVVLFILENSAHRRVGSTAAAVA